jgi:hypothetical protein
VNAERPSEDAPTELRKRLVYWLVLVVILVVLWRLSGTLPPYLVMVLAPVVLAGGAALLLSRAGRRQRDASRLLTQASAALVEGRGEEAESHLLALERLGSARKHGVALLRGRLALLRGEPADAERWLQQATRGGSGWLHGRAADEARREALGLLALVHAAKGDDERVRSTVAKLHALDAAPPESRARAVLAQMVLASRQRDDEALRRLSGANRPLLSAALRGRERTLARALARLGYAAAGGAYRSVALQGASSMELESWVVALAPRAAAHLTPVMAVVDGVPTHLPEVTAEADAACADVHRRVVPLRGGAGASAARKLLGWLLLIGLFMVVFNHARFRWLAAVVALVAVIALFGRQMRRAVTHLRRYRQLDDTRALLHYDGDEARRRLDALHAEPIGDLLEAAIEIARAELSWLESDPEEALVLCERAIARVNAVERSEGGQDEPHDIAMAPALRQSASHVRAAVLVTLDRLDDAVAELEHGAAVDAAGDGDAVRYRVALIAALRNGAWEQAASFAAAHSVDAVATPADELLGDLALVAAGRTHAAERHRLKDELAADARLAAFVERVAPGLRDAALGSEDAG